MPFYLFAKPQDYWEAGGMPGSAGVFDGESLMGMVIRDPRNGRIGLETWQIVQHEGFHQFVNFVVGGDVPTWVNEGLAEYFGEGIFTGDGMVTGIVPVSRLKRIQAEMKRDRLKSIKGIMLTSHQGWNREMRMANYDQAWSMVHFLAHADNGKYRDPFARFLQIVGNGKDWEKAWIASIGTVEGFEEKWKDYWLTMPENSTADLYAKADVASLTSFLGRAYSQKQSFDNFADFIKLDAKDLKAADADWLPPALYTLMKSTAKWLQEQGAEFSLSPRKGAPPQIVCVMPDGTRITGDLHAQGHARRKSHSRYRRGHSGNDQARQALSAPRAPYLCATGGLPASVLSDAQIAQTSPHRAAMAW